MSGNGTAPSNVGVVRLDTNITPQEMSEFIDSIVALRRDDESAGGTRSALELAIKHVHGNVAYLYGRFGDMVATRVLQNILAGIVENTAEVAAANTQH